MGRDDIARGLKVVGALLDRGSNSEARAMVRQLERGVSRFRLPVLAHPEQLALDPRWPLQPLVLGCPLGRGVTVEQCLARQKAGDKRASKPDRPRELARHDGKRGRAPEAPHCITARCECGAGIRAVYERKRP